MIRPIAHLAGDLSAAAVLIRQHITRSAHDAVHVCWRNEEGCLYLEQAGHPTTRAIERTAPHLVLVRYRRKPAVTSSDIRADLEHARAEFARTAMAEASPEAIAA